MTIIDRRYSVAEGQAIKTPCKAATTANITLSGAQTIDGVAVTETSPPTRVLVKDQSSAVLNGIYDVSTGNWTRARDFDGAYDIVTGTRLWVTDGSANSNTEFVVTTAGTIVVDSSSISFDTFQDLTETPPAGMLFNWDDGNTDADPGAGKIRAQNDTLSSATFLYVSKTDRSGDSIATFLAALDDSTNAIKGQIVLTRSRTGSQAVFNLTALTDATNYVKLAINTHSGATGFSLGDPISFQFSRAGDSSDPVTVATRTALKALDTTVNKTAFLSESGRNGTFIWNTGNYTARVAADTSEGVYIKANAISAGTGAWVRVRKLGEFDVAWFGAVQDTTTDDYTAIQAAINLAGALSGGEVLITGGAAINTGLTLTVPLVRLVGVGKRYSSIRSTNAGITLVTISAARCGVNNLSLFLLLAPSTTVSLINMASGAVQCTISDLDMVGGSYCFQGQAGSTDVVISDCVMRDAYSGASVYTLGAGAYVFDRCLLNQDWPVAVPASANDKGARANTTAYALNDYVTLSGLLLQCLQAGTSAGSPPSLSGIWYGTQITDGSAKWYIAGNSVGAAAQVDSASTYITFKDCDFTGAYIYGARVTNGLGTTDPDVIRFHDCTFGGMTLHGIHLVASKSVWIEGCEIQANVGSSGTRAGVLVGSGVAGDILIRGSRVTSGFAAGFTLSNATLGSVIVQGNMAFGLAAGLVISANVKNFVVTGNNFGSSANYGNNTTAVLVSAGTSDNYIITSNRVFGAGTGVSDGGSGVNKYIIGNV